MACSDCYPGNSTVIVGGDDVSVSGSGNVGDPFVISSTATLDGDFAEAIDIDGAQEPIDLAVSNFPYTARITLTEPSRTLDLPIWPDGSGSITLILTQDGTGSRAIDFVASGVLSAAPIVLSTDPGAMDVVTLFWTGVDWIGILVALDVS